MQKHLYTLRYKVDRTEWRARAKRKLVFQLWEQYRSMPAKKGNMLDFGCGTGVFLEEFSNRYPFVESYGIDVSKDAISYCKKRGLVRVAIYGGKTLPYASNSFDLVTAIDVLEHIKDDRKTLSEIYRVLKPGGLAITLVPAHMRFWSTRDVRLEHFRRHEPDELARKAKAAGFTFITEKNVDFLLYFFFAGMLALSPKVKGVPDIKTEIAPMLPFLNECIFLYELFENTAQKIITFPVGLSITNVFRKPF